MTDEEKKAQEKEMLEAKAEEDRIQAEKDAEVASAIEADAAKDAEIAKLKEEKENYRKVALKRLGKLEGDADFMGDGELSVAEQVRIALLDREIELQEKAKDDENKKLVKEVAELRLALKNRPQNSIGDGSGSIVDTKDNVLSAIQIADLTAKAKRLKADPEKFIENFKKTLLMKS